MRRTLEHDAQPDVAAAGRLEMNGPSLGNPCTRESVPQAAALVLDPLATAPEGPRPLRGRR